MTQKLKANKSFMSVLILFTHLVQGNTVYLQDV